MNKTIKKYENACNKIVLEIFKAYFSEYETIEYGYDWFWVSDTVGDVLCIGDYYFSLDDMITALRYNCPEKQFFDWYDHCLSLAREDKKPEVNFKNYIKYYRELK